MTGTADPAIRVAPITARHIEGYYAVFTSVIAESTFLAFLTPPPIDSTRAFVHANIAKGHPHFVALAGDRVVGWCDVIPEERESQRHVGSLGIGILAGYRGRGIGDRLIGAALAAAGQCGLVRVTLGVRADNLPARRLYEKHGFAHEGRQRKAMRAAGAYVDIDTMARLLDGAAPGLAGGTGDPATR
jgi:ribosomal protein S18 acetylase RimI-like enzyme